MTAYYSEDKNLLNAHICNLESGLNTIRLINVLTDINDFDILDRAKTKLLSCLRKKSVLNGSAAPYIQVLKAVYGINTFVCNIVDSDAKLYTDAELDTKLDAELDTELDAELDTELDSNAELDAKLDAKLNTNAKLDANFGSDTESDIDTSTIENLD